MDAKLSIAPVVLLILLLIHCASPDDDRQKPHRSNKPLQPDGMAVFRQKCVNCHGADGQLGLNGAKNLALSTLPLEDRIQVITLGRKLMTPFKNVLTEAEITAVANYTITLKKE